MTTDKLSPLTLAAPGDRLEIKTTNRTRDSQPIYDLGLRRIGTSTEIIATLQATITQLQSLLPTTPEPDPPTTNDN